MLNNRIHETHPIRDALEVSMGAPTLKKGMGAINLANSRLKGMYQVEPRPKKKNTQINHGDLKPQTRHSEVEVIE